MARTELVVLGASWGGLRAIGIVLGGLPVDFEAIIVAAQHRAASSTDALARVLQNSSTLPVRDIEDKEALVPGNVYLAPADYHLIVEHGHLALSLDARVQHSRPSIDVLFESAARAYGAGVAAVVLTGANADGADGLRAVKRAGGFTIVQDPRTAESPVMPEAAIASGAADKVLPLSDIAAFLVELCRTT
ncbi:MAG: two-component system, chemotaxis family, protein-glutamate methylesterase/glutaminase [Actinomycetota bacterium]|jgi:two-component system chemotaxis response regulator CheB